VHGEALQILRVTICENQMTINYNLHVLKTFSSAAGAGQNSYLFKAKLNQTLNLPSFMHVHLVSQSQGCWEFDTFHSNKRIFWFTFRSSGEL
jgi:hypothetical protein